MIAPSQSTTRACKDRCDDVRLRFATLALLGASCVACAESSVTAPPTTEHKQDLGAAPESSPQDDEKHRARRLRMVQEQLAGRDIVDERVLEAMKRVPRHQFVPRETQERAYVDSPLPIGHRQTISQPYIVALMTQLVRPTPETRALDIGTGSGYQAAVLAELVKEVYSIEIVEPLATEARQRLNELGYENIHVRHGDGYRGWPDKAPFDVIIVAAAPSHIPEPLVEQLAPGGIMVLPVGNFFQDLILIEKAEDGSTSRRSVAPVSFVPMTGEAQDGPGSTGLLQE